MSVYYPNIKLDLHKYYLAVYEEALYDDHPAGYAQW
jgi:hypothetical protein